MSAPPPTLDEIRVVVLTSEQLETLIRRAIEPLRLELERLRGSGAPELVTLPEAARRLGVTRRTVERWLKERREGLGEEWVGGARMVRLPVGVSRG